MKRMSEIKEAVPGTVEEMSVAKGLRELKLLDKRIGKTTEVRGQHPVLFVSAIRGSDTKIAHNQMESEKAKELFKANLQSARDLILRRARIKAAIVESNATTQVTIAGKKMTVAAAIERKTSIKYDKQLLEALKFSLSAINGFIEESNEKVEAQLEKILAQNQGSDNEDLKEGIQQVIKAHRAEYEVKLFDPLNIKTIIDEMDEEIDTFEAEVDLALTESNAITNIKLV